MKKRFLQRKNTRMYHVWLRSFMVCLCLALAGVSAWGKSDKPTDMNGDGSENSPFELNSKEDLEWFRDYVSDGISAVCAVLTDDIDMKGDSWNRPIAGPINDKFFDGNNHKIYNFKYESQFFTSNSGIIKNLIIDGGDQSIKTLDNRKDAVLCGENRRTIENCIVNMNLTIENTSHDKFGFICSINDARENNDEFKGTIKDCKALGSLNMNFTIESQGINVAGICGEFKGGTISGCSNSVDMKIIPNQVDNPNLLMASISIGGIVGERGNYKADLAIIKECYNEGDLIVEGKDGVVLKQVGLLIGGIVGCIVGEREYKLIGCYNTGNIRVENLNIEDFEIEGIIFPASSKISGIVNSNSFEGCYNIGQLNNIYNKISSEIIGDLAIILDKNDFNPELISNSFYSGEYSIGFPEKKDCKGEITDENRPYVITKITDDLLTSGEMAWALREYGYGLTLPNATNAYPTLRYFDKNLPAVYRLKYTHNETEVIQYYNPGQTTIALPDLGNGLGWFDQDGIEYKSEFEMPAKDLALTAETGYRITENIEHGTISIAPDQTLYKAGTPITVTVKADEGYQLNTLECKTADTDVPVTNNNNGTYSFTMPAADVTISAVFEKIKYTVTVTVSDDSKDMGTVKGGGEYAEGDPVTITATPNEGYELVSWDVEGVTETTKEGNTIKFIMPANNVTVTASFTEKEDPTDPEEPVDPPVDPINYYNIYNETTYDFIDVSFSRNVVREGGSVNVYLGIPEGLDPAAVTLMFKRSLYGGWENLNTDDDGNYLINNIWTDIYVKAVVDESYIDPNPDENHIYIDLSETNDSIWLYTDHKLVEEGKTAVIQTGVAKSCQNKEIRYMYKRTVLGEWKEIPKDYSINQYVVRDITTDIYVKAYFVFDKQDPTTAKNPHHVYADITATCEGLYLDATRHKVADEGDTKVFLYVKKGFETKDARYLFKRGLKGEWEDLVPGIEQNTFQVTDIEGDIYLKGIDAIYTGTEDIDGMVRVYTKDGSLFVYTAQPEEISVVSMTGVTVKRTRQTGLQSYPLNQGIYVVCVGEQVFKVRVK